MNNGEIMGHLQDMFDGCDVKGCPEAKKDNCHRCQFAIESVRSALWARDYYQKLLEEHIDRTDRQHREILALKQELRNLKRGNKS